MVRVVMILIVVEEHMEIEGPLKEEDTKVRMGGHQIEEAIGIEDTLGEGIQIKMGDPLEEEDLLMEMEDSPDNGEPLNDGGPPYDGGPPDNGGPPDGGGPLGNG